MKKTIAALALALLLVPAPSFAQHEGHEGHETPPATEKKEEKPEAHQHDHAQHTMGQMDHRMSGTTDLNIPMNRAGSGTSWLPDSSPMYARMFMYGRNMLMLHGVITPRYANVDTERGQKDFSAPNWFMGMYNHYLSERDQVGFLAMMSLDYITNGNDGYPQLFQSGETYRGKRLVDRQHPHDLFSELAVAYSRLLPGKTFGGPNSVSVYLGYPGEPALGPPTFMHRLIAQDLADAPLGHHWTDSTHITFGVATVGVNLGQKLKIEGSLFTGREPDETRYDFDKARFDSQSGRLSWNPDARNAFQISYGFIKDPEVLEPGVDQHRTTASWIYNRPLGDDTNLTTSVVWGRNDKSGHSGANAYLVEAHYQTGRHTVFIRGEQVEKEGEELDLPTPLDEGTFKVGAYTAGYTYDISHGKGLDFGVGGAVTINTKPSDLDSVYGHGTPVSFQIMLRLRPSRMRGMGGMGMSNMGKMPAMSPAAKP